MATFLTGFKWVDWRRLLEQNAPATGPRYRLRAAKVAVASLLNSGLAALEPAACLTPDLEELWQAPVFLLGLPRSGTTFLQQLLARNPQLVTPSRVDCFNPWTFVTLHRLGVARLLALLPHEGRGLDQVQIGWSSPEEDEFALTILAAEGPWLAAVFPSRDDHHRRCYPGAPGWNGAGRWRQALHLFTRKLVGLHGRRLLLKSPLHTGRLPDLLHVFPRARFVTILRDPREQFRSAIDVPRSAREWVALEEAAPGRTPAILDTERALQRLLTERYFATRSLIPAGHLHEMTYEDLVADPIQTLRRLHEQLALPGWDATEPRLRAEPSWQSYRRNPARALTPDERRMIPSTYQALFSAGFYPDTLAECLP